MRNLTLIALLFLITLSACRDELPPAYLGDAGYDYFPLDTGLYWIYDVDSIFYDEFSGDSTRYLYELKEIVESSFIDGEGRMAYRIERYSRPDSSSAWVQAGLRVAVITAGRAEKMEENIRFIKLSFPLEINKTWNGNALNSLGKQDYSIQILDEPQEINGVMFDSVCTVRQAQDITLISREIKNETYAKSIGLIHKQFTDLKISLTGKIEHGSDYTYSLIEYGKE